jgi:hypothetical protein
MRRFGNAAATDLMIRNPDGADREVFFDLMLRDVYDSCGRFQDGATSRIRWLASAGRRLIFGDA